MTTATLSRKRISPEDVLALWRAYKETGDLEARNRLVMTYAPLVKYIVFKKVRELPARCEVEDFISCGLEALIASIDRYDPAKGATLEQFAWTRIHGAVLDELRRQDWAPRSLRRWERDIHKARDQFTSCTAAARRARSSPTCSASRREELRRRQDDIAVSDVTSLNTLVISDDETTVERIDTLAAIDTRLDPEHAANARAAKEQVPPRVRRAAAARARGRGAALRQEPHAARDRRDPRRVREPRLPDPLADQAHAAPPAERRRARSSPPSGSPAAAIKSGAGPADDVATMRCRDRPARDPRDPPAPRCCDEVDAAWERAVQLAAQDLELHFARDEASGRHRSSSCAPSPASSSSRISAAQALQIIAGRAPGAIAAD